jgi:DNA-binding NarL/FixJ family response regulator
MIAEGLAVSDIAARLSLSVKTVSTHKSNILHKMNMATQGDLIRYAITHRLVDERGPDA